MLNAIIITVAVLLAAYLALSKRLAQSSNWKLTLTPLDSSRFCFVMVTVTLAWEKRDVPLGVLVGIAF